MTVGLTRDELRVCYESRLDGFYRLAMTLTGNHADAEDAVQDAVVRALQSRDQFRGEADVCTWMHRIVVNSSHDRARKRATELRRRDAAAIEARWRDPLYSVDPAVIASALTDGSRVRAMLARLSPAQRTCVLLHDSDGWTTEQIAELLEIPRATVKSHLRRGRQAMVSLLAEPA
ncbi:MAG: sigma-70 family RNA polymerase sigma factor [Candidatus Dormibacteria bacterium]